MKKLLMVLAVTLIGVTSANALSLADARSRIDKAIENKEEMASIMKQLSAADQKQFLAEVNAAIAKRPGTKEEIAALFINANRAALTNAAKDNLKVLTAEMFATVTHDGLTAICENFSRDLFNRNSDPNLKPTDEEFTKVAMDILKVVGERVADTDNPSTRMGMAIIMLLKASNGKPEDLSDKLVETIADEDARGLAKDEWIPHAVVPPDDDRKPNYDPILASADVGRRPDYDFVLVIVGPQHLDSVLADILGKNASPEALIDTRSPVLDAVQNKFRYQIPHLGGDIIEGGTSNPPIGGDITEPGGYQWQTTY